MSRILQTNDRIIDFESKQKKKGSPRKIGINKNKEGSVRGINQKVYVDFMYLGQRVREPACLSWSEENAKYVRKQLDRINVSIESGAFSFADTFPKSKKKEFFIDLEQKLLGRKKTPDQVLFKDHVWKWYNLRRASNGISGRTLGGYKGYIEKYLLPFYEDIAFGSFNKYLFDEFVSWAKDQKYRGKSVDNESVKKYFIPLKMICKDAAIKFGWGGFYDPFFGFEMPKGNKDPYEKIYPFSVDEQDLIIAILPYHWKPYFRFAFACGLSQGEQIALMPINIDWEKRTVRIKRAMTRDESGTPIEGPCKNKYRRRKIKLSSKMLSALEEQKKIYDKFNGRYFFCTESGKMIDASNLRSRVWIPTLQKAAIEYRAMIQTRHSFGTYHLSKGKDPLKIAKVMGHRNAEMVIKVYSKLIDDGACIGD